MTCRRRWRLRWRRVRFLRWRGRRRPGERFAGGDSDGGGCGPGGPAAQVPWTPPSQADREQGLANLESKIGQRWIAWVGAIVVFLSVVFFLKYAFQNDWIGPTGQVVISALGGVALAAGGSYFSGRKWRIFGQCLMGLGVAILYAAFYGAFQLYNPPVIGQNPAFGLMIAVTVAGMTLAVLHDAVSLAFLAVLGGVLTPRWYQGRIREYAVYIHAGAGLGRDGGGVFSRVAAAGYAGDGGDAHHVCGVVGKFLQAGGVVAGGGVAGGDLRGVFDFAVRISPGAAAGGDGRAVRDGGGERGVCGELRVVHAADGLSVTMGFVCLGMAAAYLVLGVLIRKRLPSDGKALFGAITLTVTFLTLAVPMQLRQGIMLAWVAEGPVLAFFAYRFRYMPLRVLAFLVLVVGVGRLLGALAAALRVVCPFANKEF